METLIFLGSLVLGFALYILLPTTLKSLANTTMTNNEFFVLIQFSKFGSPSCCDFEMIVIVNRSTSRYVWESKADGAFTISEDTWNEPLERGTEIRLHLREEIGEYIEESKLKLRLKIIKKKLIWNALDGDKLEPKILVRILP